jgi:hydroxyacylglutathione hydrolase
MKKFWLLLALSFAVGSMVHAQFSEPNGGDLERGVLPEHWRTGGPKCMEVPEWQVHEYNANFFILRQSGCTDTEMPFLYLMFGKDRGLLWDTGSRNGNLASAFKGVVHQWLERNQRASVPVMVIHSHSHGDHTFGDAEMQAIRDAAIPITFVAPTVEAISKESHIDKWPDQEGEIQLGERALEIIPIPGHDVASIALYDRKTGILLTGDSLYPGRLYVRDFPAFHSSTERLIRSIEGKPVAHILGNHIEETSTPFLDSPIGSIYHPHEHVLELTWGTLLELESSLEAMKENPRREALRDFTIWPLLKNEEGLGVKMGEIFRTTQEEQLKNKWDQNAHRR